MAVRLLLFILIKFDLGLLILSRGEVAEGRVPAFRAVEALEVLEDREPGLIGPSHATCAIRARARLQVIQPGR
jgi:transposase